MKKRNGFTLIELVVVIAVIVLLVAIFMPTLGKVKPIAQRVVCGTNMKGLGNAVTVYANDFDGCYPQLPGNGPWGKELGFDYYNPEPDFAGAQANTPRTVSASLYLLVRLADVSHKSFVCPESDQEEFDARSPKNLDIVEMWDFGADPYQCVSYAYHNPYGKYPAHNKSSEMFSVLADMNPWFEDGNILSPGENKSPPQILNVNDEKNWKISNSSNHVEKDRYIGWWKEKYHGQNVLYVDGHVSYENSSNVGIKQDNIYTYWSAEENPSEQDIQGGTAPTERNSENDAKSEDDSFLVI